ncbi:MAG TPA: hypothetical protein DC058_04895 [Planctomycetaceae bacterium]|jgi:hypothetical protein|nr:hypothetical protein [Planctomycetaceae bacterium]
MTSVADVLGNSHTASACALCNGQTGGHQQVLLHVLAGIERTEDARRQTKQRLTARRRRTGS